MEKLKLKVKLNRLALTVFYTWEEEPSGDQYPDIESIEHKGQTVWSWLNDEAIREIEQQIHQKCKRKPILAILLLMLFPFLLPAQQEVFREVKDNKIYRQMEFKDSGLGIYLTYTMVDSGQQVPGYGQIFYANLTSEEDLIASQLAAELDHRRWLINVVGCPEKIVNGEFFSLNEKMKGKPMSEYAAAASSMVSRIMFEKSKCGDYFRRWRSNQLGIRSKDPSSLPPD